MTSKMLLEQYMAERHALGFSLKTDEGCIRRFLQDFAEPDDGEISFTKEYVLDHIGNRRNLQTNTILRDVSAINGFLDFVIRKGYTAYKIPPKSLPKENRNFRAYIFTDDEIERMLTAADHVPFTEQNPARKYQIPVMFRILFNCGLRTSELLKLRIAKLNLSKLDKKCIEDFLLWLTNTRGSSPSTYNQRLCAIHAFFDCVMTEEPTYMEQCILILKIPSMVSPDPPAQYLTPENLKHLLSMPDTSTPKGRRHLVLLTVLYDTAARVSELADICMRDVRLDFPAVITLHGKGGKIRTVPLMKPTTELLRSYLEENHIDLRRNPDMPLFWNGSRHKLTRSGITYIVQKYADMARETASGMPTKISPHIFRHTKAMHMVQANVNPVFIKDYLGHADISTTEVYARADNEAKRAALEKATAHLDLPKASQWEQDAELIEWLSSLG